MESIVLSLATGRQRGATDLTPAVAQFVDGRGDGLVSVFVPHATAGVAIFELGAGSDLDVMATIDELIPREDGRYHHRHGSPGHGADHVIPALVAPSITVPVINGHLTLGTWQSIVLVDPNADNTQRSVRLSFIEG